ncbi:MAG: hypothetical protein RLZZ618_2146 [Pseudomonadota bacterium]
MNCVSRISLMLLLPAVLVATSAIGACVPDGTAGELQECALRQLTRQDNSTVGYDTDYFELMGPALRGCGHVANAGRFLFLSGKRMPDYTQAITQYLGKNSHLSNHRQLQSSFPQRVRVMWKLHSFPSSVAEELRALGWPESTQPIGRETGYPSNGVASGGDRP